MVPVSDQLEKAIRKHERLLISLSEYRGKLARKEMVSGMLSRQHDMEMESIRVAIGRVQSDIEAAEREIADLKAVLNG